MRLLFGLLLAIALNAQVRLGTQTQGVLPTTQGGTGCTTPGCYPSSSPLTTKGDLYGFSTADARLPVGVNGLCLVTDSGEALGIKWGSCASGSGTVTSIDLLGTTDQITVTGASPITTSGTWTLSFPTNLTLPGTTTGTFSGNLTGDVTGNVSGTAGSASTVTGFSPTAGKTLSVAKTMTLTAADDTGSYTLPTGTKTLLATDGAGTGLSGIPYTISGTPNQVVASAGTGNITLSTPQDIATGSSPQFAGVNVGHATDSTITRTAAAQIAVEGKGLVTTVKLTVYITGTAQTFTAATGMVYAEVWVTGQGGGGGGCDNGDTSATAAAGGGGAGGTAYKLYSAAEMGATALYTVGTAAGGGGPNTGGNGTAGTDSTFDPAGSGATLTGTGGALGTGMTNTTPAITVTAGGAGGGATNGDLNLTGGGGSYGFTGSTATTGPALGGFGGASYYGGGALAVALSGAGNTAGGNGAAYGAGGGGAVCINTTAGAAGGNGAVGAIVIKEYVQ